MTDQTLHCSMSSCPWCDKQPLPDTNDVYVRCNTTGCPMEGFGVHIDEWNTRAQASAPEGGEAVVCWSLAHRDSPTHALFADCVYDSEADALADAAALNGETGDLVPVSLYIRSNAKAGEVDADTEDAVVAAMLAYAERCDDVLHTEDLRDAEADAQRLGLIAFKRSLKGALSIRRGDASE